MRRLPVHYLLLLASPGERTNGHTRSGHPSPARAQHTGFLAVSTQKDQAAPPRARRAWLVAASLLTATLLPSSAGMSLTPQANLGAAIRMEVLGTNPQPRITGTEELRAKVNYSDLTGGRR